MIGKSQQIRITDNVFSRFGEIPKYRSFEREREKCVSEENLREVAEICG